MITFACACGKSLKVADEAAGKKVKCPACGQVVLTPQPVAATVATPSLTNRPTSPDASATISGSDVASRSKAFDETVGTSSAGTENVAFLAPPLTADEIGRLGIYRVLRVLGQGGMGMVLEAEDPQLKRRIALKVMLPQFASDAQAKQRFLREAQAAAALEHDHIITIHQVSEDRGVPFLAMPLLKGESLGARLKRVGRLPLAEAVRIGAEIADGLAAAHDAGLIHRDIKPANIWLVASSGRQSAEGRVKILDFGLARAVNADDNQLTGSGVILGTPAYMSPEQARGIKVDHRADLFSLGCVLYQMTTGDLPFKGSDTFAMLTALAVDTPADPCAQKPDTPSELSALILHLLAKNPDDRPAAAGEVQARLGAILTALPEEAETKTLPRPAANDDPAPKSSTPTMTMPAQGAHNTQIAASQPAPRRRRVWPLVIVGLLFLIGGGLLIPQIITRLMDEKGREVPIKPDENGKIAQGPVEKKEDDVKKEGDVKKEEPKTDPVVEQKPTPTKDTKKPPKTDKAIDVNGKGVPSIDLIFPPDKSVKRITESVVAKRSGVVAFTPDGTRYAGNVPAGLAMFDVLTGNQLETFSVGMGGAVQIQFTDAGNVIAAHGHTRWGAYDLNARKQLGKQDIGGVGRFNAMHAGAHRLIASEKSEKEMYRFKVSDPWTGKVISILDRDLHSDSFHTEFSPSGKTLVTSSSDIGGSALILWNVETGTVLRERKARYSKRHQFSPNGKYLASLDDHDPGLSSKYHVRLYDVERLEETKALTLVGNVRPVGRIAFHPDNRHLAFCVQPRDKPLEKSTEIFVLDTVSGRLVLQLVGHTHRVTDLQFCPQGKHLVSICYNENRIWKIPPLSNWVVAKNDPIEIVPKPEVKKKPNSKQPASLPRMAGKTVLPPAKWVAPTMLPVGQSPFDKLDPKSIPAAERFPWQPAELVAVIGTHADRAWSRSNYQLALSPDGKLLAMGGRESPLVVWDVATRTCKQEFPPTAAFSPASTTPKTRYDGAVTFSADGKRVIARVSGESLSMADLTPAAASAYVPWKDGPAAGSAIRVFLSPDNNRCITVGSTIQFWDLTVTPAKLLHTINEGFNTGERIAVTPDCGRLAYSSRMEQKIIVLDISSTEVKERWKLGTRGWTGGPLAISDDGTRLVSATNTRGSLAIWDLQDPPFEIRLDTSFDSDGHFATRNLAFTHDGQKVIWAAGDTLCCWNVALAKPKELWTKRLLHKDVNSEARWVILPDNKTLIFFTPSGLLQYIDIAGAEPRLLNPLPSGEPLFGGIVVDQANGRVALTKDVDRRSQWWDLTGTTPTLTELVTEPDTIAFTPDGRKQVLQKVGKSTVELFVREGDKNRTLPLDHGGHFSSDGDFLWIGNSKGPMGLDLRGPTPQVVSLPMKMSSPTNSPARYLLRHDTVYPQFTGNTTTYWDLTTRVPRKLASWFHIGDGHRGTLLFPSAEKMLTVVDGRWTGYAMSPDGWQLESISNDDGFRETDPAAYHPSEKWYVAARGNEVMLRRSNDHEILKTWTLKSTPQRLEFAPDGRHLFIATGHHTVYVLRLNQLAEK